MKMKKITYLLAAMLCALPSWATPLLDNAQMDVEFVLPKIKTGTYARPYVAIWIENSQRKPVRTLQLWVKEDDWLKDLRSWWRKVGRNDRAAVDAMTSATRPAGKYRFTWDARDQQGNPLEQGEYTFYAEVVREHGGRNYLRQKLNLSDTEFRVQLPATQETGLITLNYQTK